MVRCPNHKEALLIKTKDTNAGAKQVSGVWFEGFICPVGRESYSFEDIYGEGAIKRYIAKLDYGRLISPYLMTPEELKGIFRGMATEITEDVIKELIRRGLIK